MPLGMSNAELAQLGIAGASGLASGYAANNATKLNAQQLAMQQRLAAMQNQQQLEQSLLNQRTSNAAAFADRSPLGAEQDYARKQAMLAAILPQLTRMGSNGGPTDPAIRAAYNAPKNPLQGMDISRLMQTISPDATARALTDRRTALAGIDPTAAQQYRPLSDYGLDNEGVFNQETQFRANQRQAENDESIASLRQSAMDQLGLSEQQAQQAEQQHGHSIWKTLAKVGIIAGGAIATAMTAGAASPALAAAIGAGTGAASGAIDGGWRGALMGGAIGGVTGGLMPGGSAASGGAGAARAAGASTADIIRQSILNPRTIGQMTGAGIGGSTGAAISGASAFLPGANYQSVTPRQFNNQMSAQSFPQPQIGGGSQSLNLPGQQNMNFAPYPSSVGMNRNGQPSAPASNRGMGLNTSSPIGGTTNVGNHQPINNQSHGASGAWGTPDAQRMGLFESAKIGGAPMPQGRQIDPQYLRNYGQVAGPAMNSSLVAPLAIPGVASQLGRSPLLGEIMPQGLLAGQTGQRLLTSGRSLPSVGGPAGSLPSGPSLGSLPPQIQQRLLEAAKNMVQQGKLSPEQFRQMVSQLGGPGGAAGRSSAAIRNAILGR